MVKITYDPKKRMIPVCAELSTRCGSRRGYGMCNLEATVELLILVIFNLQWL